MARPYLSDRLAAQRAAAIVAPSGYGKSMLVEEAAERLGLPTVLVALPQRARRDDSVVVGGLIRALASAGLPSLGAALRSPTGGSLETTLELLLELLGDRADSVLFVFDEIQNLSDAAGEGLRRLAATLPEPHRIVFVGQSAPSWLASVSAETLGVGELAFGEAETVALARAARRPIDSVEAEALVRATAGWPAAIALAVEAGLTDTAALGRGLEGLVAGVVARAPVAARDAVAVLCSVPLLSHEVAVALAGPGALATMVSVGIPLRIRPDSWLEVPEPIREICARSAHMEPSRLGAAAQAYFDAGSPQTAINFLIERRALDELVEVLAGRRWQDFHDFDPIELRSLLSVLPGPAVDRQPRLLLLMARAANAAGAVGWRGELLERAARSEGAAADARLAREIDADRAALASLHGDVDRTIELARHVLDGAASDEVATRARALAAIGRARAFERDPSSIAEAEEVLTEAVTLARLTGEHELLAAALLSLGYNVHFARGDLPAAAVRLREAADAAPTLGRGRANILTFLSDALMYAGELDEADSVLREVADTGRRLRDQSLLGYHAWMKAAISSRRGDAEALGTWLADAERHPGDWFGHPTGIEFLAEAVDMCGRIGDYVSAAAYLERVEQRCAADPHEGVEQIAILARAVHYARAGDAVAAEPLLVAVLEGEQLPPRDAWRMQLLRGLAALRRGDESGAASFAARAFEEASALGGAELPWIHEPDAVEQLLPLARRTRSVAVRRVDAATPTLAVRVLGDFSITADGRTADPPPGRPQTLVKLLAVAGRSVALEEAIETLWPEVDPDVGRARMRNVLTRIRQACGELVQRAGSGLALADDVLVDAAEFEREARAALAGAGDESVALARRAVGRYAGELLPADRYDDFTVAPRERLAQLHLALVDRLAADAERSGDVDEALARYSEAISAAPLDEHRYEHAAALALRTGRRQRAAELVAQARRVLDELGVEPSPALAAIAREVAQSS